MTLANDERAELSDLLLRLGPDAPTLCEGWQTRDLAAHLYIRENRPDAAAGIFVPVLTSYLESITDEVLARPYADVVRQWAAGAPLWNPMNWLDKYVNAAENFIHHEDVRRAQPEWQVRKLSRSATSELWSVTTKLGRLILADSAGTVVMRRTDGVSATLVDKTSTHDEVVTVTGTAGELLLWLYGRNIAEVDIDGDESLVKRRSL